MEKSIFLLYNEKRLSQKDAFFVMINERIEKKEGFAMVEVTKERRFNDADGCFSSVQEALDYLENHPEQEACILVHPGIYQEQVEVRIPGVVISGESSSAAEKTVITCGFGGWDILPNKEKRGTFRSYTFFVNADDVRLQYLTIENSAGQGTKVGQGISLYADGDRMVADSCRLLGWQDTLFTAPLPPKELEKNGFAGPKQYAPRENRKQYYKDCYIEGEVDFIFGGASAYFERCTFFSKDVDREIKGFVTAPSTPCNVEFGYVMESCRFIGNCPKQSVFLGRPWREWGKTVLLRCEIGEHIRAEGWDDWGKEAAHQTSFFAEYACTGPGANQAGRPEWTHVLTREEANHYSRKNVLGGFDGWINALPPKMNQRHST